MKILTVHNYYQRPGGEDCCFANEAALLEQNGHEVLRYTDRNQRITNMARSIGVVWSARSFQRIRKEALSGEVEIAHFHNTFPLISPSAYFAVRMQGIPVVQTVHNFRMICPAATLFRNGSTCDACVKGRSFVPALLHCCYRDSLLATSAVTAMITAHSALGTWQRRIDIYIAPSEFVRRKLIQGGLPAERIEVKPHHVADHGCGYEHGVNALFVGRLSEEKGVRTLAEAWKMLPDVPLRVAGDGPVADILPPTATRLGHQPSDRVTALMKQAYVLIVPSVFYETGPLTILEAFACGLPVIASELGSIPERVSHKRTGLLFRPGDPADLAAKVRWAFDHPEEMAAMGAAARREFELKYTAERNYAALMNIYSMAIENARARMRAAS